MPGTSAHELVTGAAPMLVGSAALLALTGYAASRYPASLEAGGSRSVALSVGAGIAYGIAAATACRARAESRGPLSTGAAIGTALGIAAAAHTVAESFVSLPASVATTAGVGMWAIGLSVAGLLVLAAGAMSIRTASGLARSERPPFVMAGLSMIGVALASGHALATGVQRRDRAAGAHAGPLNETKGLPRA